MTSTADVVICGAGIAGIAAAHALTVTHGVQRVVIVDERAPMTLTSDKSTEAYRNWWPSPDDAMVQFMNRSIDLLEQWADASDNRFLLNRRGYVYATTDAHRAEQMVAEATRASVQGAGPVRVYRSAQQATSYQRSAHTGYRNHPAGADVFIGRDAVLAHFSFLSPEIQGVLHARRCGWLSGQQLGMYLLEEARAAGATFLSGRVVAVNHQGGRVHSVRVDGTDGATHTIATPSFVNSAGPMAREVGQLAGVDLPIFSELHLKMAFEDTRGVINRDTGLVILEDAQRLAWTAEERDDLAEDESTRWLTETMPAGVHFRPEGYRQSQTVLMLWDYHGDQRYAAPQFPLPDDPLYAELTMRGMVRLVPGLAAYLERLPQSYVDGGYYTKTEENRPLVGPAGIDGVFVNAAFSGYGVMAAPAAGELVAQYVTGVSRPEYASAFRLDRYDNPAYQQLLKNWGATGQL